MDTKRAAYLDTLEYILDEQGKKHYVSPMKVKDRDKVQELFSKINDEYIIMNLPAPLLDNKGNLVLDDDGNEITNVEPYIAMMELLELALHDPKVEDWIDIAQISDALAMYRKLSQLKKKLETEMTTLTGIPSLQDSCKTQV